jgi:hypothetical protein
MTEKLTFGELCEAIVAGKVIQKLNGKWEDIALHPNSFDCLCDILGMCETSDYRIKPERVKRYNWICKNPVGYWILGNNKQKYTREDAEFIIKEKYACNELVEPYLPSEASE